MIEIKNLEAGYNHVPKLRIESVLIEDKAMCLVRGESGSGKTTLLNVLAGLMRPIKGSVNMNGVNLGDLHEAQRDAWRGEHLGYVFQTLHLVKPLTVMENILLGAYAAGKQQDKDWADYVLGQTGLHGIADRKSHEISQGQAQRVAIARAVINKPSIILADEPTSSLDQKSAEQVIDLLLSLAK